MLIELLKIFWIFFKIGLFTFGGGYAMIPLIQQELVKNNYLTQQEIIEFIGISESTPGPFAVNIATFTGFHGIDANVWFKILGSSVATLGVVLPSFIIIFLIAKYSERILKTKQAGYILSAIQPMVLGFILSAFLTVTLTTILGNYFTEITFDYKALIIFGIILILGLFVKKIPPVVLIVISMILGIIIYGI
ncbi:MAG: chromate transporter [Acholeplasmatales bacterium]